MPELNGGGTWVVDVLAGGLRSRTLIQKGHLHAAQWISNAGSVFRVFDADGNHAPNAKVLYGNREFAAEKDGNVVLPFGQATQSDTLILVDGAVASVQPFVLYGESYSLVGGFMVDPQSILSGGLATLVTRPSLLCQGQLVSLSGLENPELTITTTDLDGIVSVQSFADLKLADSADFSKSFVVPQRLAKMDVTLRGKVLLQSKQTFQDVSMSHSVTLNEAARIGLKRHKSAIQFCKSLPEPGSLRQRPARLTSALSNRERPGAPALVLANTCQFQALKFKQRLCNRPASVFFANAQGHRHLHLVQKHFIEY
jgi:hypothetical protein